MLMSNKWLPAASSTRPFWALTSATAASEWPPGPPRLWSDGCPCQHFYFHSWLDAFKPSSSESIEIGEALCLPQCSLFKWFQCSLTNSNSHNLAHSTDEQQGRNPNPIEEGRTSFWIRCLLNPVLGRKEARVHIPFPKPNTWLNSSGASEQG